jgi:hypothetical protein
LAAARVLAACVAGEARALVVAGLDRLARSLSDAAQLLERAQRESSIQWGRVFLAEARLQSGRF